MYFVVCHLPPFENFPHQPCFYIVQLTWLIKINESVVNTVRSDSFIPVEFN